MTNDLTITFTVDQRPEEVFAAILDVAGWWGEIGGTADKLGAQWTYRVADMHYNRIRVAELMVPNRVAWHIEESYLAFVEDKEEWVNTTLTFDVTEEGGRTRVRFAHVGLRRDFECFDVCSNAWSEYINGSLRDRITSGVGRPNSLEGDEAVEVVR